MDETAATGLRQLTQWYSQHSSKRIHRRPCKRTFLCRNFLRSRKKVFLPGNSSRNSRSPIASSKAGPKSNSLTRNVASRAISPSPSKTRFTTGKLKSTISPNPRSSVSDSLRNHTLCLDFQASLPNSSLSHLPPLLILIKGWHKFSLAYTSPGTRRYNQPFSSTPYGPSYVQGDVIGVGYRPRTGTVFFTRNGKKLDDVAHGLKSQNFFPTVGANGPCTVHVNFGQSGFVFIEANVKKWGLAPMTGSLAPPPPYGSEQGSILLEAGRDGTREGQGHTAWSGVTHSRTRSGRIIIPPNSPGPLRSPTEISLAQLAPIPSHEDIGEGTSRSVHSPANFSQPDPHQSYQQQQQQQQNSNDQDQDFSAPPPEYTSPEGSLDGGRDGEERRPLLREEQERQPIPSYDAAVGNQPRRREDGSAR